MFNVRGRGRNREVKCFTCGEIRHMSWECPKNKTTAQRNANISKPREDSNEEVEMNNPHEEGESLMMKRVLVKTKKKMHEPAHRKILFKTKRKSQGNFCKMVIDSGSIDNLVSTQTIQKLGLKRMKHPTPYKVSWLQKGDQLIGE